MLPPIPVKVHHNIPAAQCRIVNAKIGTLPLSGAGPARLRVRQLISTVIIAELRHIPDFNPVEQRPYRIIIIESCQHQNILVVIQ
ncbi:hypothetical protein D3C73_1003890 [compost metagenome]